MSGVEQSGPCAGGNILDTSFSLAILMVGVDSAKRKRLLTLLYGILEQLGIKEPIISMTMLNGHTMGRRESFESELCFDG